MYLLNTYCVPGTAEVTGDIFMQVLSWLLLILTLKINFKNFKKYFSEFCVPQSCSKSSEESGTWLNNLLPYQISLNQVAGCTPNL